MNMNTKKKPGPKKADVRRGDLMRVKSGPLEGAEGTVVDIALKELPGRRKLTFVEIRQLNGNPVRLPRHHFEFSAMHPREHFE
jgi:transcription antitermination factor NusG